MATEAQLQHINTILTHVNPYKDLADDMRSYARNFPEEISSTFIRYGRNLEDFHKHYSYPIRIYAGWMAERAKVIRPETTAAEAGRDLAPLLLEFIEKRSNDELKEVAMIHARMMYVSLWSIYDSFLSDFVCGVCNEFPVLFGKPAARAILKKILDPATMISSLTTQGGHRLGDLIFAGSPPSHRDLQRLLLESDHFGASKEVQKAFGDSRLYLLEKRRHLVAHNAGAIDGKYLTETASTGKVGDLVEVSAADVIQSSSVVHEVAFQLAAELTGYIKANRGL